MNESKGAVTIGDVKRFFEAGENGRKVHLSEFKELTDADKAELKEELEKLLKGEEV
jgi:hypothetical protein